jgi:hypothetical protein
MKSNYFQGSHAFLILLALSLNNFSLRSQTIVTFTHTGAMQTYTIPPCAGTMTILARGAEGGYGGVAGRNGGSVHSIK